MRRRRQVQYPPMTSLLDVLFIVVFASLIHSAALEKKASEAAALAEEPPEPEPAPQADAGPPAAAAADPAAQAALDAEQLRGAAMTQLMAGLEGRTPLVARVGRDGRLRALERLDNGAVSSIPLSLPLVERVPDPDVALVYLGDQQEGLRLCSLLRLHVGAPDLSGVLVIVALDAPIDEVSVALANGLQRDAERCLAEQRGIAVIVDPRAAEAARQQGGTP
jgi:hypothetical protein